MRGIAVGHWNYNKAFMPRRLLKTVFFVFILMELADVAALWAPVYAADRGGKIDLKSAIARVAKQNIPAVVHIEVVKGHEMMNPLLPLKSDPSFRYLFNVPSLSSEQDKEFKGVGTGMFIDDQGHVLTTNHVAAGANAFHVLLADGRQYPAKLIGTDPETDLAVIGISANEAFPHVTFGDSDKVGVGDWVVAIGQQRGLEHAVTKGIISADHRKGITNPNSYQDFLQTDAPINPSNSGGPLLNLSGEVIGISSTVLSQSCNSEGIGIAIPSNIARHIVKQLLANGSAVRGWLGAGLSDLSPTLAKSLGLNITKGALIAHVVRGGPADQAGIKKGDVVISYEGKEISNSSTLQNEVGSSPIGQEVAATVFRNGTKQTLTIRIESLQHGSKKQDYLIKARLGVDVRPMTANDLVRYDLNALQGLVITSVHPGSPLASTGFEPNDVMLEVNGQPIDGLEDFMDLISALRPEQRIILLGIDHRTGRSGYVQVVVP
jgi:serine protease Do